MDTVAILRCFADLAERNAGGPDHLHAHLPPSAIDVTRAGETPVWLGSSVALPLSADGRDAPTMPRTDAVRNLATLDALQPTEHLLRLGWVVVVGRLKVDERTLGYCFPLVSQPVVLRRTMAGFGLTLHPAGELELTPLVEDPNRGATLEQDPQFGGGALAPTQGEIGARAIGRLPRLQSWIRQVVASCGLPPLDEVLPPHEDPLVHRSRIGLAACVGSLLYARRDVYSPRLDAALRAWADTRGIGGTAFSSVYGLGQPPPRAEVREPLDSPFPLSPAQRTAAARARTAPLSVISGPPGSGK
ncbi:MAG TPA: hypothetical protein VF743_09160, partial [Acidimicrobiales bacterium]